MAHDKLDEHRRETARLARRAEDLRQRVDRGLKSDIGEAADLCDELAAQAEQLLNSVGDLFEELEKDVARLEDGNIELHKELKELRGFEDKYYTANEKLHQARDRIAALEQDLFDARTACDRMAEKAKR